MKNGNLWELPDDELEQHLLRHGRSERAPDVTRRLVLAGAVAGSALATKSAAAGVAPSVWWLAAKWLALGASSGLVVISLVTSSPPSRLSRSPSAFAPAPVAASSTLPSPRNPLPANVGNTPLALASSPSDASSSARSGAARAKPDGVTNPLSPAALPEPASGAIASLQSLQEELGLLKKARWALDARATQSAFDTLALYDARFPAGRMRIEAQAMRTEAHFVAGQSKAGQALARAFLASYPQSPAALHVRRLLDMSADTKP